LRGRNALPGASASIASRCGASVWVPSDFETPDMADEHDGLLITVAGAAAQLSQPQAGRGEDFNPTQILAASLGQQFAILGQLYAQAGLAIPPTLEIRPAIRSS
jgi:hypothetical protein